MAALTDEETRKLILALGRPRGDAGFSEEEAQRLIDWAVEARTNAALLELVLAGRVRVTIDAEGDVAFQKVDS